MERGGKRDKRAHWKLESFEKRCDAIIENDQIKENIKKEEEISQKITTLGYENSVEIIEQTIKISILNKNHTLVLG